MNRAEFIEHLRTVRLRRGLRQVDVAAVIGVAGNTVGYWETGWTAPVDENLRSWARALGVQVPEGVAGVSASAPVARCGTRPGYQRHRRLGEPRCDPCTRANNEYHAARRLGDRGPT